MSILRSARHHLARRLPWSSELDLLIPPEIAGDEFFEVITRVAAAASVRTALEIGASSGAGSTRALVAGLSAKPDPRLFCLEVSVPRFRELKARYAGTHWVKCFNLTSVGPGEFPTPKEVAEFYDRHAGSPLRAQPLKEVLRWLSQDLEYVARSKDTESGIDIIKQELGNSLFDLVLIDGSEFTGSAELKRVYGARYVLLDDIRTFKNFENFARLSQDPEYRLIASGPGCRNGFAAFRLATAPPVPGLTEPPIAPVRK